MSVFLDEEEQLRGDEQEWCMQTWQSMFPFLEGETGERDEDQKQTRKSQALAQDKLMPLKRWIVRSRPWRMAAKNRW